MGNKVQTKFLKYHEQKVFKFLFQNSIILQVKAYRSKFKGTDEHWGFFDLKHRFYGAIRQFGFRANGAKSV